MQQLTGCASLKDYIKHFETRNLLDYYPGRDGKGDRFPMVEARERAAAMLPELNDRKVIFVGSAVGDAFGWPWGIFDYVADRNLAGVVIHGAVIPHPSPVNRYWNDQANWTRGRLFFDKLLGRI